MQLLIHILTLKLKSEHELVITYHKTTDVVTYGYFSMTKSESTLARITDLGPVLI